MSVMREDEGDRAARAGREGHAVRPQDAAAVAAGPADAARAVLAGLQQSAADAYAAITAADDALRVLAGRRVTAERALRRAAARHAAAARAAAAHARARPGPFAQLATGLRARREWRQQRPVLEAALGAAERQLTMARQVLSAAKADFTAGVSARAEVAATLRRLTAECAAARAQIAAADGGGLLGASRATQPRPRRSGQRDGLLHGTSRRPNVTSIPQTRSR
jgi:hypothetical protein